MKTKTSVNFQNNSRIHFGLSVSDLEKSIAFYKALFQAEPKKIKADYAKFELDDPSINLALDLSNNRPERETAVTHFGVQVKSQEAIENAKQRLSAEGWPIDEETETLCCYAEQNKIWATDPDGNRWEVFRVTDYQPEIDQKASDTCCVEKTTCC